MTVFWDVMLCGFVIVYQCFRRTDTSTIGAVIMEAAGFSEMSFPWVIIMGTSYFYTVTLSMPHYFRRF